MLSPVSGSLADAQALRAIAEQGRRAGVLPGGHIHEAGGPSWKPKPAFPNSRLGMGNRRNARVVVLST
jgi:hypothetical protein